MDFNLRRVIWKDYTTIATTSTVLALTEFYEQAAHYHPASDLPAMIFLLAIALICGVSTLAVRTLKKRYPLPVAPAATLYKA